jgi:uncharacterized protein (TIGR02246 family)
MIRNCRMLAMVGAWMLLQGVPAIAWSDDVSDVKAATSRWLDAFNRKSTRDIVALYAPDAVLFGTSSPVLRHTPALILDYFSTLPTLGDATIALGEHRVQVFGDVAINSGFYTRSQRQEGKVTQNPARFTFVYSKRDGEWLIVNHHSSALP